MGQVMTVRSVLKHGMEFHAESGSGHSVILDASRPDGGEDAGFRPMELLLVGLAACTGMDVISILRKKRQEVTGYEVRVRGTRAETHPMVFVEIVVEHHITGRQIDPAAVARAVELSETKYCGAGAMLGAVAHLTHIFHVTESDERDVERASALLGE